MLTDIFASGKDMTMATPRHKNDTKTFEELSYAEQAKSISAQLNVLQKAIRAHTRRAEEEGKRPEETMLTCIAQVARMLGRLSG